MTEQRPETARTAILVVDDSKVIRIALQRILQGERVVYEAADGEEAWSLLQRNADIGLVLTDLSMPGLDGQDLLLRIRDGTESLPADLPVVIVTGQESDETASREWLQLGANAVLIKPFVPSRVRELVNELLPRVAEGGGDQALRLEVDRLRRELMIRQQSGDEREAQREIQRLRAALGEARDEATAALQRAEESEQRLAEIQASEMIAQEGPGDDGDARALTDTELTGELEALRARLREFENENIRLDHELVELDRLREAVQKERDQALDEAARLRQERNEQCERAAAAERARADLEARCSEQDGSTSALGERLAQREQELAEARERNQTLRTRIRELEQGTATSAPTLGPALSDARRDDPPPRVEANEPLVARAHDSVSAAPALAADASTPRLSSSRKRRSRPPRSRGWRWLKIAILLMVAVVVGLGTLIFFRNF